MAQWSHGPVVTWLSGQALWSVTALTDYSFQAHVQLDQQSWHEPVTLGSITIGTTQTLSANFLGHSMCDHWGLEAVIASAQWFWCSRAVWCVLLADHTDQFAGCEGEGL